MENHLAGLTEDLDWNKSQEQQQRAIVALVELGSDGCKDLIPGKGKNYWKNAVEVIKRIGSPGNRPAIPGLIYLLKDMSWPGAEMAYELLLAMDKLAIVHDFEMALHIADQEQDSDWIAWIKYFLAKKGISAQDFENRELWGVLEKAEW